MRFDHRLFRWGVFFIALGAVPLAVRASLIDSDTVVQGWRLWPLLLVGLGVSILLRGTRIELVGGLIVSLTFGVLGGGLIAGGTIDLGSIACGSGTASGPTFSRDGTFGSSAAVDLDMRCGDLTVHSGPGSGWSLSGVSNSGHQPDITTSSDRLSVKSGGDRVFLAGFGGDRERWDVTLPQSPMLDLTATVNAGTGTFDLRSDLLRSLDVTVNAGSTRIDLDGATLSDIGVTVNAGDTRIVLPDTSLSGSFTVNAGSIRFCTPADAALRLSTSEHLTASYDFGTSGLIKDGSTWTSPNYASAAVRIDLSTTANAGSIALNPMDGCR